MRTDPISGVWSMQRMHIIAVAVAALLLSASVGVFISTFTLIEETSRQVFLARYGAHADAFAAHFQSRVRAFRSIADAVGAVSSRSEEAFPGTNASSRFQQVRLQSSTHSPLALRTQHRKNLKTNTGTVTIRQT